MPVEHHLALARYYDTVLECTFELGGERCEASEVFHREGFLPLIVEVASSRSMRTFNQPLKAEIVAHESALLGKSVVLPDEGEQRALLLLMHAAELVFKPVRGKTIELYPIFEYCWMAPEKRARAAWQPTDI
ncbi:hypothetical protein [Burkholderia ubonensis]|uniref:Uncharacterized protein n=1 Tax=Burkholderia ubonensis subsp. mesacidophila TaxID=265293 RepID=A0A2A4F870_9BURK|nr:hypothetical protein [Burkholderia ubonensis]PCE30043.1 hypothetical protein BZL54_23040 [Burkholderia ubonensis subsp. mesacidophila]